MVQKGESREKQHHHTASLQLEFKMRTGVDLTEENVEVKTQNPVTRRALLSQIIGLYDPIGQVMPGKQKGVIRVRRAFQEAGRLSKDTWDEPLSSSVVESKAKLIPLDQKGDTVKSLGLWSRLCLTLKEICLEAWKTGCREVVTLH